MAGGFTHYLFLCVHYTQCTGKSAYMELTGALCVYSTQVQVTSDTDCRRQSPYCRLSVSTKWVRGK